MSDNAPPVNETEAYLSDVMFGDDRSAGELSDSIHDLFCSHYNTDQIIAALAHTLVVKHVDAHTSQNGSICRDILSVSTTELLQTLRKWVEDCVEARLTPDSDADSAEGTKDA